MKYVIFGPGRVGKNIAAYVEELGDEAVLISRRCARDKREECVRLIKDADIIAAAIPDSKLENWCAEWLDEIGERPAIHFSGAITIDGMYAYHPLYSFPPHALDPAVMKNVAFACSAEGPSFEDIFPGAPNPNFRIADEDRAHYHALAVLSGNFAAHLWNETAKTFETRYNVPAETILAGYFTSIVDRFRESPMNSLTGPVARHDEASVEANLEALEGDEKLTTLYRAFLQSAWPGYK